MDVESHGLPQDPTEMGSTGSGHVCIQTDNTAEEVLQLETRSRSRSSGCFQPGLEQPTGEPSGQSANRVLQQQITLVLVAPVWKSQPQYPILLDMLVDFPVLLPHKKDLIIPTHPESVPAMVPQLAEWLISGNVSRTRNFCRRHRAAACIMETEVFKII